MYSIWGIDHGESVSKGLFGGAKVAARGFKEGVKEGKMARGYWNGKDSPKLKKYPKTNTKFKDSRADKPFAVGEQVGWLPRKVGR